MSLLLNKHRNFDFLELSGLEKVTGVPAGRWHLYALKELLDNALDADEAAGLLPKAEVVFKHRQDALGSWTLLVEVANAATFPDEKIRQIATWDVYVSSKDFVNRVTRGRQGNALKTLMGMPYALRHHTTGGYDERLSPLMIDSNGQRYFLVLDAKHSTPRAQTIVDVAPKPRPGTLARLILPNFAPAGGISQSELIDWADQYAVLNPFAKFDWLIEAERREAITRSYSAIRPSRSARPPVIHWYDLAQFRRFCSAMVAEGLANPVALAEQFYLSRSNSPAKIAIRLRNFGIESLKQIVENENFLRYTFETLVQASPTPSIEGLEGIAREELSSFVAEVDDIEGELTFETATFTPLAQRHAPTTIQVALWRSRRILEREFWFAVNHAPLYRNPFQLMRFSEPLTNAEASNSWLSSSAETELRHSKTSTSNSSPSSVGHLSNIESWLDELGVSSQDNVRILIHVVSPNLRFQNFGKSEFDCEFLQKPLKDVARRAVSSFTKHCNLRPSEKALLGELQKLAREISHDGQYRYTATQLYTRARQRWMQLETRPETQQRLTVDRFGSKLLVEYRRLHGPLKGLVGTSEAKFLPPTGQWNRVLWLLADGVEEILLCNNWHHQLGVALLWGEFAPGKLGEELVSICDESQRPVVLALHDATVEQLLRVDEGRKSFMQLWPCGHFVDIGLTITDAQTLNMPGQPVDKLPLAMAEACQQLINDGKLEEVDQQILIDPSREYRLISLTSLQIKEWLETVWRRLTPPKPALTPQQVENWLDTRIELVVSRQVTLRMLRQINADVAAQAMQQNALAGLSTYRSTLLQRLVSSPQSQWEFEIERFVEEFLAQYHSR